MKKIPAVALALVGLLVLQSPEAAAHQDRFMTRQSSPCHHLEQRHRHAMPHWLKRNRSFRHWYKQTGLRRNRHLSWHQLFDIFQWQTIVGREHRKAAHYRHVDRRVHYRHDHRAAGRWRKR